MRRISRLQKPLRLGAAVSPETATASRNSAPSPSCARSYYHATARQPAAARLWSSRQTTSCQAAAQTTSRLFGTTSIRHEAPKNQDKPAAATEAVEEQQPQELAAVEQAEVPEESAEGAEEEPAQWNSSSSSADPELVVPGLTVSAPRPDEIADTTYLPAQSGDELEEVGGLDGWWENDVHWDPAVEFRGFGPRTRVTDAAVLEVLARQAVLEALAVQANNKGEVGLTEAWSRSNLEAQRAAAFGLAVELAADGSVSGLQGDVAAVVSGLEPAETSVAEAGAEGHAEDGAGLPSAEEAGELVGSWDASWKGVSLSDASLRFAITKRILQLTGHILPDADLIQASTVGDLVAVLIKTPKAKKLAQELERDGTLKSLPNVAIYERRVTPIDKHKQVGRWKVIVQELEKRGLPVTGTGGYSKSVERKWLYR